jgi:hypothetical protein
VYIDGILQVLMYGKRRKLIHFMRGFSLDDHFRSAVEGEFTDDWKTFVELDKKQRTMCLSDQGEIEIYRWWRQRAEPAERRLLHELRTGSLLALGYQKPIFATDKREVVARELWDFLQPDFLQSSAAGHGLEIVQIELIDRPLPGSVPTCPPQIDQLTIWWS